MTADDFRAALNRMLADAQSRSHKLADVTSGNLHREVGGYPGDHRIPIVAGNAILDETVRRPSFMSRPRGMGRP
jgi:hypothetical protein